MRKLLVIAAFLAPIVARAQSPIMAALQTRDWAGADGLARQSSDPLAAKLVTYMRLLAPDAATGREIGAFIAANASWPQQGLLQHRLSDAVASIADDGQARELCEAYVPGSDTALIRCARAERSAGHAAEATILARRAWVEGISTAPAEDAFLHDWAGVLDDDAQWRRFDSLISVNVEASARQVARVDASRRALAAARLAFRRNDRAAMELAAALPPAQRRDPVLLLDQARWLRANQDAGAALNVWRQSAAAAEVAAQADRKLSFWVEREKAARDLLMAGDAQGAYFLADDPHAPAEKVADASFLAGWIALRKLHDPVRAAAHFNDVAAASTAVITQGRAYYWLGRAASNDIAAKAAFAKAALFPTSYYGQLAAARLDGKVTERIQALAEPTIVPASLKKFETAELVHAATLLMGWGDAADARRFLLRQAQVNTDAMTAELTARCGLLLGLPDVAVQAARLAGAAGTMLPHLGWPAPFQPPAGVDAALALGVMRQESGFDAGVVSPAGAVGLMQLRPGTAQDVAAELHAVAAPLADPATNMRLGTAYLQALLAQFGGVQPYALAAYNAGPRRARQWVQDNGDAATSGNADDMIDWIEAIPFAETRNYVQRVLEGQTIYRAFAPL